MHSTMSVLPHRHALCSPVLAHFEVNTQRSASRQRAASEPPPLAWPVTVSQRPPCCAGSRQPLVSAQERQSLERALMISCVVEALATLSARVPRGRALVAVAGTVEAEGSGALFWDREHDA